jgi:Domain of unknown function (DUF4908)
MSHGTSLSARSAAAFAAALTLAGAPNAFAQPQSSEASPLQGFLGGQTPQSQATRYATPDGAVRFVLDRSLGPVALVRFEGDPEVHVLRPVMAARGDEIYRTESGDIILRVTANGGITVYTRSHRTGSPASEEAQVAPLAPNAVALAEMRQRFRQLQVLAARQVGQTVTFEAPEQFASRDSGVVLDAAERAAQGLAAAPMTTVRRVVILIGPTPRVAMRGDTLFIQVAPQMGYAGRPSSTTIRNVATGAVQGPEQ